MIFMAKIMKKTTNFMISGQTLDEIVSKNKKLIIIFGHPKCKPCQRIMLKLPILFPKTLFYWYALRFCNVLENPKKCKEIWVSHTPSLFVYKNWKLDLKISDDREIENFLANLK